ncbi:MAG TPA: tetratricopeptide repeat protein, partial [Blastocatellia bacterium]|nr:tetratricopeptide repeat protein [Blastocatellia bacterium]
MNKDRDLSSQSGEVVYGDQASGNITATGGVGGDVVAGDKITNVYAAAAPTVMALHQLPSPPADFTGREAELEELTTAIAGGGVAIAGLRGQGGVGKTALALQLAARLKDRYPDAQFYLDLRGAGSQPMTVAEALAYVLHAYHPGANLPEGEAELRAAYLSVLHGRRVLLLMDNAKDRRQVEPLIPPAGCLLLVTSRQSFMLPGIFARNLDSLPADDACRLLLAIAPRIGESATEIARLCGHLPLALRLAACAIAERPNLKPADYVRRLAKVQPRLELIEATLSLSYEMLSEELQRQWRSLAVFPKSFSETGATAVWEAEDETAGEVLGELLAFSLVEWDESTDRYRLHDLARVFADSRLNETEREAGGRRHAAHYLNVLVAANGLYLQGGDGVMRALALYDLERANIESGQSWAAAHAEDQEGAEFCLAYPREGASVLALRQHPLERLPWFETMLAVAQRLQLRHPEGQALRNLGRAHMHLGQSRRALEFFERYLELARRTGDRRGEGDALANLGNACIGLGETRRALEFLEQ